MDNFLAILVFIERVQVMDKKVAVFAGQGAQAPGMGKDLAA